MKIAFDTEFVEDGRTIDLLSIGMVREDGLEFYAETEYAGFLKANPERCVNPWVVDNVLPSLIGKFVVNNWQMQQGILDFIAAPAQDGFDYLDSYANAQPVFWAYFASYDWVALCQIFGTMMMLPEGWPMYCRDWKQHIDGFLLSGQQTNSAHNALGDALWLARQIRFAGVDQENLDLSEVE